MLTRYLVNPNLYKSLVNLTNANVDGYLGVTTRDRAVLTRYVAKWKGYDSLPPVSGEQTINYDNGDTVFVPDEVSLSYDREKGVIYYNNTLSVYLTKDISTAEEQRLAKLCDGEVVGRINGTINSMQIKVSPTHLDTLNNYADLLMNDNSVLFAIYDSPTVDEDTVDQNPWRYDGKDEPTREKGNEDNPNGNDWWAEAIGAYTAWRYTDSGFIETPAPVGMMETGIDKDHEDLSPISPPIK